MITTLIGKVLQRDGKKKRGKQVLFFSVTEGNSDDIFDGRSTDFSQCPGPDQDHGK